ncbi:MAG TPA: BadF/BadG/BcrA/BcrD ATPase family protein [Blastocatellia bacterium]|nr:BadF/BadG/BcrA/BcrD ATPase family protein [Blastocatellia bacterium]
MSKSLTTHPSREPAASRFARAAGNPADALCFLGVDGGGTKTHAIITTATYKIIGEGFSGASNPVRVGFEAAAANINQAVKQACEQAHITPHDIAAGCAAIAGISHPIHYHTMRKALDARLRMDHLELVTDARAALEGALDGQQGIVLIAGTGSIAMGMTDARKVERSGGWGPTLGDEGSGYDIARQALKAVAASFDGRAPRTDLTERICRELGITSAKDLPGVIYNNEAGSPQIASLARLVADAAAAGDAVARGILAQAGRDLGELAVSVIRKLGLEPLAFRVACVGSVFKAGECVLEPLREAVRKVAPRAEIGPPLRSPEIGAVKLAQAAFAS